MLYKKLIDSLKRVNYNLIIVTNEVGWGIIPENKLSRKYVDNLGLLNKKVASLSDNVYLMVSGIGVKIK
ncbi:bifunctional adenosylcobinamide kinase/adenosylcobinamide-phosphate guanylyltransferase [Thermosipho africanus]|uniref:bifunctional adenosylcobinamide kinase/adenosylcobinamide-phosphate guanylyltransferase n=1 Tax=Thermosipho africanus TaxID=2421 RepID=UPI002FCD5428